jgi:hypothetical protein
MTSKLESSGPPDEDRRITQVAGPTKVAVKGLENCAAQDNGKISPACPET